MLGSGHWRMFQNKKMTTGQKKALIFVFLLALAIIFAGVWNSFVSKKLLAPPSEERESVELSPEVLRALTPPPGAEPIELSPEVLRALTPPPGAEPIELSPEVLRALTPQ
jgi:hypothetical protein